MTDPMQVLRGTALPCQAHTKHIPASHLNHWHHVWPRGEGGPNIKENQVVLCPTGHYNVHELIKQLKAHKGAVPYSVLRTFSVEERKIAKLGYERITRQAM